MNSFEESLKDISGLTAYRSRELPKWSRSKLVYCGYAQDAKGDDLLLIETLYRIDRFEHWGAATIDGQEVSIFEFPEDEFEELKRLAFRAPLLECGFFLLEKSESYKGRFTTIVTEHFAVTPHPRAAKLPAAEIC